jgi:hypothetical protein
LVGQVNAKRIEAVKKEIMVQEVLPVVVDYIQNHNPKATNTEISGALSIPEEIVAAVMSKPIGYLRKNKDTAERVKELKKKLSELKKFDPVKFTHSVIQEL